MEENSQSKQGLLFPLKYNFLILVNQTSTHLVKHSWVFEISQFVPHKFIPKSKTTFLLNRSRYIF
jgi:hypothetical protein